MEDIAMTDYSPVKSFIKVVCTKRGNHDPFEFESIVVRIDGSVSVMTTRTAQLPRPTGTRTGMEGDFDGLLPSEKIIGTDGRRDDFDGHERWRFKCGVCDTDVPLNKESLTKIGHVYDANHQDTFDISHMPRL
jgi:hypothetical protein